MNSKVLEKSHLPRIILFLIAKLEKLLNTTLRLKIRQISLRATQYGPIYRML